MTGLERFVLLCRSEQGLKTHHLGSLDVAEAAQAVKHIAEQLRLKILAADGGAAGHEQMGVVGANGVLVV